MKARPLPAPAAAPGGRSRRKVAAKRQAGSRWMMPAQFGPGDHQAALGRELQQRLVARHADRACFGKAAGQDQEIADAAVGAFADGVEDGVGADDDHGEVDRRIDGGDRGHRFVTEYRAALGIDRHDPSAITGLAQQLHDGAARRRGALAGADHGDAAGREERREVAGESSWRVVAAQAKRENKMADPIELLIQGRAHELGPGFAVRRVLPSVKRRMVGPFIFLDHFGPMVVPPGGDGMEVRPHPHIGLATVTYLFDGGIFHRDSLGYAQAIRPGDVNWMTAGSGIAHSERTEPEMRRTGFRMHGIQTWVALPKSARGDGAVLRACRGGEAAGVAGRRRVAAADRRHLCRPHGADDAFLADLLCRRRAAGRRQDRGLARACRARRLCRRGRRRDRRSPARRRRPCGAARRRSRSRSWPAPAAPR